MPRTISILSAFALLTALLLAAPARALVIVDQPEVVERIFRHHPPIVPPHPHPIPTPPVHRFAPLEIKDHKVEVTIKNQVAVTSVEEVVHNQTGQRVEGTFLLPVPKGAEIDRFTMAINGKQVEAELLDAKKARETYERIVRSMKDPALLEYNGRALFKVRIFPIEPNETKKITLKYTQLLKRDTGMVNYVYPLNTAKFCAQPIKNVSMKVTIESSDVVKGVYSPTHELDVSRKGKKKAVAGFEISDTKNDVDFHLIYSLKKTDERIGLNLVTFHDPLDGEKDGYFMLLASPGAAGADQSLVEKDVVFVFDTSGSMRGDKIKQAKEALQFCVANLNEGDRFEVVRFSTEAEPLFGKLVDANEDNCKRAETFIDDFKPIGGTAIDEAIGEALEELEDAGDKDRPKMVIFLTDGRPTIGESNEDRIVANVVDRCEDSNVRVFSFGVGHDVNTHLIDKITEATRAVSQYVLPTEDIEVKVSSFYTKIAEPVLTDLKLKVHGEVRISSHYPKDLPDLFRGDQLVLFGRYSGDGEHTLTLQGKVNGKKEVFERKVTFTTEKERNFNNDYVARLWASRRIGFLLDEINLHGEKSELKDEVVRLARAHGIVTPYTSFLIIEDEDRRGVPVARQTLREINLDEEAKDAAGAYWYRANNEKAGEGALARAQSNAQLKTAPSIAAADKADDFARYDGDVARRLPQQNVKRVRGRSFYQNGKKWVDNNVQDNADKKPIVIKFGTKEYFDLLTKHPEAAEWLSVGRNVELVIEGELYEIVDEL